MSGNSASRYGGGIYVGGSVTLFSSSVTGNTAGPTVGSGGGIYDGSLGLGVAQVDAFSVVSGNRPDDCVGCVGI